MFTSVHIFFLDFSWIMSDGLATINTDNLTAAIKNVYHSPLTDAVPSAKPGCFLFVLGVCKNECYELIKWKTFNKLLPVVLMPPKNCHIDLLALRVNHLLPCTTEEEVETC